MLESSADFTSLESIFRKAGQRLIEKDRIDKLRNVCQECLREELEGIRHGPLPNAMLIPDLNVAGAADDSVRFSTAYARRVLKPVCRRPGEVRRPDFAVRELDKTPGIIGVSKRSKIRVDSSLTDSYYPFNLLLRVCEVGFDVQKIPSRINLPVDEVLL
jgi:hypothetical protein